MRSIGRLGWGGSGGSTPTPPTPPTPADLTAIYQYQTIQVNAKNFYLPTTVSASSPSISNLALNSSSIPTLRFSKDSDNSINSMVGFFLNFNRSELDISSPSIKLTFNWINYDTTPAPSPTRYVKFSVGGKNCPKNSSSLFPSVFTNTITAPVLDRYILNGGNVANIENTLILPLEGILSASDSNLINIEMYRDNTVTDNYAGYAYLLGVTVQYKTNFANVSQWST